MGDEETAKERYTIKIWIKRHYGDPLHSLFRLNRIWYRNMYEKMPVRPSNYSPDESALDEIADRVLIGHNSPNEILIDWYKEGRLNITPLLNWPERFPDLFALWVPYRLKGEI